jgi:hypothetical protein
MLFLYLLKHRNTKAYWEMEMKLLARMLNLDATWRCVVSFTFRPLYHCNLVWRRLSVSQSLTGGVVYPVSPVIRLQPSYYTDWAEDTKKW